MSNKEYIFWGAEETIMTSIAQYRKRGYIAILICAAAGAGTLGFIGAIRRSPNRNESKPPVVEGFDVPQSVIDIGRVWPGQSIARTFTIINRTGKKVKVDSATSDCGCTIPTLSQRTIAPHGKLSVGVTYQPPSPITDAPANVTRKIAVVISTITGQKTLELWLKGTIEPDRTLRAFPHVIDAGTIQPGNSSSWVIHFEGDSALVQQIPSEIELKPTERRFLLLKEVGSPTRPGAHVSQADVRVTISQPKPFAPTTWNSELKVGFVERSAGLAVHINGRTGSGIAVIPETLMMNTTTSSDTVAAGALVTFENTNGDFMIPESVSADSAFDWNWKDMHREESTRQILHLRIKQGRLPPSLTTLGVRFSCKGGGSMQATIPIVAIAAPN